MSLSRIHSKLLLACLPVLLATTSAQAQRQGQVPEYVGQANAVVDGASIPLERQNPQTDVKIRAFGFGGAKARNAVNGEQSPVRFRRGQNIAFIVRVPNQEIDPLSMIRILPVKARKGQRQLEMITGSMSGSRDRFNERAIAIEAQRYGRNAFRVSTAQPLEKGEYALVAGSGYGLPLNLFAID
jgi:hypothetical protein